MKNILSSLNESEKRRILEMHYKASNKQYLNEQEPEASGEVKTGVEKAILQVTPQEFYPNTHKEGTGYPKGVNIMFDYGTGKGKVSGQVYGGGSGGDPLTIYDFTCECRNPGVGVKYTRNGYSNTDAKQQANLTFQLDASVIYQWIKPKCKVYLDQQGNCDTKDKPKAQSGNLPSETLSAIVNKIKTDLNYVLLNLDSYKNNICMYLNSKQYDNMSDISNLGAKSYIDQVLKEPKAYGEGAKNDQGGELTNNDLYNLEFSGRAKKFCGT